MELNIQREKHAEVKNIKVYNELEVDMFNEQYSNSQVELEGIQSQIYQQESEIQKSNDKFQVEMRIYEQKMRHLEFELERSNIKLD